MSGVGPEHFGAALRAMVPQGLLTPLAATFAHSHNDLLYAAATLGVPGLLAVFAMYVVPAAFFLRHLRAADSATRVAAIMGLATSVGFFIFGLTEAMFYIAMTNAFYTLLMATFFAFVVSRSQAGAARHGSPAS